MNLYILFEERDCTYIRTCLVGLLYCLKSICSTAFFLVNILIKFYICIKETLAYCIYIDLIQYPSMPLSFLIVKFKIPFCNSTRP